MKETIVIPLFKVRWSTRAVLEGLQQHYQPEKIHVLCPAAEKPVLEALCVEHALSGITATEEETAFVPQFGLSKEAICADLDLQQSLYNPGWYYQQILKLGAPEIIPGLSENYLVWDSDLLPVATWPVISELEEPGGWPYRFALLQDSSRGNASIIEAWERWIRDVLGIEPVTDPASSFVPHHMWFNRAVLEEIKAQLGQHYQSEAAWLRLMMRTANDFGTFSEFWLYGSWLAAHHPEKLRYHPYEAYGATTERFFDDGSGRFSQALRRSLGLGEGPIEPSYTAVHDFIAEAYQDDPLPSSLSFESSPRHLKKGEDNRHVEEIRSRWQMTAP